jgi:hypothetical protein
MQKKAFREYVITTTIYQVFRLRGDQLNEVVATQHVIETPSIPTETGINVKQYRIPY